MLTTFSVLLCVEKKQKNKNMIPVNKHIHTAVCKPIKLDNKVVSIKRLCVKSSPQGHSWLSCSCELDKLHFKHCHDQPSPTDPMVTTKFGWGGVCR